MNKTPSQLLDETRRPEPPYRRIVAADGTAGTAEEDLPSALVDFLASPEKLWRPTGDVLKPGSRSTVTRTTVDGTDYVIKQYKAMPFHRRVRYALTRSRARQSWQNGQVMARLGIPVVRPLALLEESSLGIPARAILIMPYQVGDFLSEAHAPGIAGVATALHEVFALMRRHRITHGDLKATNIIIDETGAPHFIDLDATLIHTSEQAFARARAKDEARFRRNWEDGSPLAEALAGVFD